MSELTDPININVGVEFQANEDVKQEVVVFKNQDQKLSWLKFNLLYFLTKGKVIIFVNQRQQCQQLEQELNLAYPTISTLVLHGEKLQQERTTIINQFKKEANLMIATDVASR